MEESICRRKWTTLCKIFTFCPDECGKLRGYPDQWTWHYCYIKIVWLLFFPLSSRCVSEWLIRYSHALMPDGPLLDDGPSANISQLSRNLDWEDADRLFLKESISVQHVLDARFCCCSCYASVRGHVGWFSLNRGFCCKFSKAKCSSIWKNLTTRRHLRIWVWMLKMILKPFSQGVFELPSATAFQLWQRAVRLHQDRLLRTFAWWPKDETAAERQAKTSMELS